MKPSHNPFRSSALQTLRYCLSEHEISKLLTQAEKRNYRACIKGPHGTGKSTLLADIAILLEDDGKEVAWHYINRQMSRDEKNVVLHSIIRGEKNKIHCLDGGESLGFILWNFLICYCYVKKIPLLATTHFPCLLPALFETKNNLDLTLTLSAKLAARYWDDSLKQAVEEAYYRHSGNMRDVFGDCYLYCARNK